MSIENAVQDGVYDALQANTALLALVEGIFDNVPQDQTFPYVSVGEDVHSEWDTDTTSGTDCTITIHTWSRHRGRTETKEIQGAIYDALHLAEFSVSGYRFHPCYFVDSTSLMDADGITRHGIQTFRVLIERV